MKKTILFIYGTLKRGCSAHHFLKEAEFLGEARTAPSYRVYDLGRYPGLIEAHEHGLNVLGELWAVDEELLARLDDYEGTPALFARKSVEIAGFDEVVEAYLFNQPIDPAAPSGDRWPLSGD